MLSVQELRLLQAVISSENYVRTVFFAEIGEAAENLFVGFILLALVNPRTSEKERDREKPGAENGVDKRS